MAYIILTANGDEIDRRALSGALTIGRAQDADLPVRDILLSRKHCRIEPSGEHWIVVDLGSKNGTYIGNRQVTRHTLKDGDEVRLGRTHLTFRAGPFEPAPEGTRRRQTVRPADPTEALAGTVAGFILVEPGEVDREPGAPVPQPRPPEPSSYASEDVYGMLNEIASSSWDSIMAQASRPLVMERPLPRPHAYQSAPPRLPSRRRVAFCLQAPVADGEPLMEPVALDPTGEPAVAKIETQTPPARSARLRSGRPWWNVGPKAQRQIVLGVLAALATALLVGAWVVAVNQGPQPSMAAPPTYKFRAVPRIEQTDLVDVTFPSVSHDALAGQAAASIKPDALAVPNAHAFRTAARIAAVQFLVTP